MINRKITYAALALLTLGLASCSQEDDFTPDTGKDTPITIASATVSNVVATRSYTVGDEVNEDGTYNMATAAYNISLYISSEKGGNYAVNDLRFGLTDGVWITESTDAKVFYEGAGSTQEFAAIYPFRPGLSPENPLMSLHTDPDQPTVGNVIANRDKLLCFGNVTGPELNIIFKHLTSKVSFNVTYGNELGTAEMKTLTLTGLPDEVKVNIFTGEYDTSETTLTAESKFPYPTNNLTGMMIPYTSTEPLTYGITVETTDGRYFTTTFQPCRKDDDGRIINYGFEAGYAYTVNLKVGKDKIEVTSVDTGESSPWGTGWENETELN